MAQEGARGQCRDHGRPPPPPRPPPTAAATRPVVPRLASRGRSSQTGRNGRLAHHQVAPELIVDDGRQQVHQKQASFEWRKPESVGTTTDRGQSGRRKQHRGPRVGGGTQGPRGPTRAQQTHR